MKYEINKWFGNPIFITKIDDYESINKDIKELVNKDIKPTNSQFAKTTDIKSKIETLVKKQLKNDKPTQKEVAKISEKVLVQFYKTMWTRRSFWSNKLDSI